MSNTTVVTAEYLKGIKYNDLKAVLEGHGIGMAFKGGAKKADIIQEALVLYKKINAPKEVNPVGQETSGTSGNDEATHASEVIIQNEIKADLDEQEYESEVQIQGEIKAEIDEQEHDSEIVIQAEIETEINAMEIESEKIQTKAQVEIKTDEQKATAEAKKERDEEDDKLRAIIKKLSQDQIQKNLDNIAANLTNNIPGQKNTLLRKKAILLEFVKD